MSERRDIVSWKRDAWPNVVIIAVAVMYPNLFTVGLLTIATVANYALALLAEKDAEAWYRLWRDHGPEWRKVRP